MYIRHEIGRIGEKEAKKYILEKKYSILQTNYRTKFGEIDIIARDLLSKEIVFIEVKTRTTATYGHPAEAVDRRKLIHIFRTAQMYLYKNRIINQNIRFDIIEVYMCNMKVYRVEHIKDIRLS